MNTVFVLLMVLIALAAVLVVVLNAVQEQQRRQKLRTAALRTGLTYSADSGQELWDRVAGFALFSKWGRRRISNVLHRQIRDIDVTLFDYRYTTSTGKHHRTYHHTVALFETARLGLPRFTLNPQYFYHEIANALGFRDIDFEQYPEFSDGYRLKGNDEASIRALFDEDALLYFTRHPGLHIEGSGRRLILYREGRRVDPAKMEAFMQQGLDVLDVFMAKEGVLSGLELLGLDIAEAADDPHATEGQA